MIKDRGIVAGNVVDKYKSKNPITRLLMNNFLRAASHLYQSTEANTVLEVGCGEGELCAHLNKVRQARFIGTDLSPLILEIAKKRHPYFSFQAQSATSLGFADKSFDLVIACEVLEHLPEPELALNEIARVTKQFAILSVPCEPLWRILNITRGAYIKNFGNTPGHLQHWSRKSFVDFVSKKMSVKKVCSPLPWTMVMAQVK